jgi:hypothetical protein
MAISNGYCVYDTWDMLRIGMARQATFLMVHHGLLLACFYIALQHVRLPAQVITHALVDSSCMLCCL